MYLWRGHKLKIKPFVLSLSKHEGLHGLRQAQAERSNNSIFAHVSRIAFPETKSEGSKIKLP